MKKLGMVFGAAAVAVVAGCKDPDYRRAGAPTHDEVKDATPVEATPAAPQQKAEAVEVEAPKCACPAGTKHTSPCACGAADCACIVTPKPVPPPKPAEPEYTVYVVQNGDYLAKISKKFNVTIGSIKRLNGLSSDLIRVGQKLKIPGKVDVGEQKTPVVRKAATKGAKPASAPAYTGATKEYVVKNGDTLGAIAYSNGINIRQLKAMNGLTSDSLKVGQKLKVPAEKVVSAKKTTGAKATAKPAAKAAKPAEKPAETKPAEPAEPAAAPATEPAAETPATDATPASADSDAPAAEAAPVAAATPATIPYTVQEGEDITAIVVKFGANPAEIRELNNLGESDTLKAGQVIKIPAELRQ